MQTIQNQTDSIANNFLNSVSNFTTFNQDSLNKAKDNLTYLEGLLKNTLTTGIIIEPYPNFSFNIIPNPTSSSFTINSNDFINALTITDATGNIVLSTAYQNTVDVSNLAKGIYIVHIESNGLHSIQKLLIQ